MEGGQATRFGPTRRGGPVFRWLGEPLAVDLANTLMVVREGEVVDLVGTPEELGRWLEAERPRLGDCTFARSHHPELCELRDAVHALLTTTAEGAAVPRWALDHVNSASAAAPVAPQLSLRPDGTVTVGGDLDVVPPIDALRGRLARAAIELLADPDREPLHVCHAPSCGMVFLGDRRWCCASCGNRARAARHYRRSRER